MKKMVFTKVDKFIDKLIDTLIPTIIIMIPVVFILYILNIHDYFYSFIGSNRIFRLDIYYRYLMYILAVIYIYKLMMGKVKITRSDLFLFLFMLFTIVSTIFAYNTRIALFGYPNRFEGLFTILFYIFLYLNYKEFVKENDVEYLLRLTLGICFIELLMVVLQFTGLFEKVVYMYTSKDAIGLTENCNFLGSLMCTFSMVGLGGYLLLSKKEHGYYYLIVLVISYITLLFANSTGPFISFIGTFIILCIYLLIKKKFVLKKMVISLLIIICLYPICLSKNDKITPEIKSNFISVYNLLVNGNKNKEQDGKVQEIKDDVLDELELGHGRVRIWSNVIELIKDRPLIGYGPDNLGLIYYNHFDEYKVADKAHNIYLHIFVSSGLFALIGYVLWTCTTFYLGLKSDNALVNVLCFGIIAYSIQGLFNINVLEVTPYYYLLVAFMMFLINEKPLKKI